MKESKIEFLEFDREWGKPELPKNYQFNIAFESGDKGSVSFKTKDAPVKVGDVVKYDGPDGKYKLIKLDLPRPAGGGRGFGGAPRNEKIIVAQNALSHATALVVAGKIELKELSAYADKCFDYVCKKGGLT